MKLLEPSEQDMIKALIVNKFRGDRSIFRSGVEILEQRSGKPVAGVVPYVHCDIEDEDSLSAKLENRAAGLVDIAVIRLPRISNFTDLDVFRSTAAFPSDTPRSRSSSGNPTSSSYPAPKAPSLT